MTDLSNGRPEKLDVLDSAQPYDLEAELAVLGSVLLDSQRLEEVRRELDGPADFFSERCRIVYEAMEEMDLAGVPIDVVSVWSDVKTSGAGEKIGGLAFLNELTELPSAAHAAHYAKTVRRCAKQRRARSLGEGLLALSADDRLATREPEEWDARLASLIDPQREQLAQPEAVSYRIMSFARLAATAYTIEYLIEWLLVRGQPCILAGGKKTLKTSLVVDLIISLATGGKFLGILDVPRPCHVLFMSGESGEATIKETALRVAHSKVVDVADLDGINFSPDLPQIGDARHHGALKRLFEADKPEVVVIDPAYLAMPGGDAANLFIQGALLRQINELCRDAGATLILVHHTRRNAANPYAPPELEDISWAGYQEFARQWMLVGRRERYEPGTGQHKLWLNAGGSAGHSCLYAVDINEGPFNGTGGRYWQVDAMKPDQAREAVNERAEAAKAEKDARQLEHDRAKVAKALAGPLTKTELKTRTGIATKRLDAAIAAMFDDDQLGTCTVRKNKRDEIAFMLKDGGK